MVGRILILMFVIAASLLYVTGCGPNDSNLIQTEFGDQSPGYSSINIVNRAGNGTSDNPRILTIQATINSYPNPVICEGELVYRNGDPSHLDMGWFTWEGVGHSLLVFWASKMLEPRPGPPKALEVPVSLLLKHWVDSGMIKVDDIKSQSMYHQVRSWIENPGSMPVPGRKDAGLFDTNSILTYDLAPELSDDRKDQVAILRPDGVVELYLLNKVTSYEKRTELYKKGVQLAVPIKSSRR